MKTEIHIAGDIILEDKLVYEPLGNGHYLYNMDGIKGISLAKPEREKKIGRDGKVIEGKKIECWKITFKDKDYLFKGQPILEKLPYSVPSWEIINDYINEIYLPKEGNTIYLKLLEFIRTTLDLPEGKFYYVPCVTALQSWLRNVLKSVFYIGFDARFGSGKSIASEIMALLSYHGYFVGDIKQAGISRLNDRWKLSLYVDEIDAISEAKDNEVYTIFRKGYRRNNPYIRINPNTLKAEVLDVFGVKGYTFHSDVETALKTRSLIAPMMRTQDKRLPLIDSYKEELAIHLAEDLFFWYIDNAVDVLQRLHHLPILHQVSLDIEENKEIDADTASKSSKHSKRSKEDAIRQDIYEQITKDLSQEEKTFLWLFTGRNIELAYNIILISKAFKIELIKELEEIFLGKEEDELYSDEDITVNVVKELLADIFNQYSSEKEYRLESGDFKGCFYYPKNQVLEKLRQKLKEKGFILIGMSKFTKCLKEIGFQSNITIRRQLVKTENKNLTSLIFADYILKSLDLKDINKPIDLEVIKI